MAGDQGPDVDMDHVKSGCGCLREVSLESLICCAVSISRQIQMARECE